MNYIFLDIDGVMNNYEDWMNKVNNKTEEFHSHRMFCDKAWLMLSEVCTITGAKIVLSSSWRLSLHKTNDGIKSKYDNPDALTVKLLDYFHKYNIPLVDITTNYYDHRGKQIKEYIKRNLFATDKYVVIDDEDCDIKGYIPKETMIKTEFKTGLLQEHCDYIINYFRGVN